MRWSAVSLILVLAAGLGPAVAPAAECAAPKAVVTTAVGMKYCADPAFDAVIAAQVQRARQDTRAQRQAGKLIVYASTPISPRGGGHVETNLEIAASVKNRLEKEYGAAVWVLDPGRYQMPDVGGKSPGGAEYMVMWTAVLAGPDGRGRQAAPGHRRGPRAPAGLPPLLRSPSLERVFERRPRRVEHLRADQPQAPAGRAGGGVLRRAARFAGGDGDLPRLRAPLRPRPSPSGRHSLGKPACLARGGLANGVLNYRVGFSTTVRF